MRIFVIFLYATASAAIINGCSTVNDKNAQFKSLPTAAGEPQNNPLIGKIIRTSDAHELSAQDVYDQMAQSRVVYLGEVHENHDHHRLQLDAVRALLARGRQPALGFEFFSMEQTAYLMSYVFDRSIHADQTDEALAEKRLRENLGWGANRDAEWQFYVPLLRLAKAHKLPVFGADLPAGLRRRLVQVGLEGLSTIEKRLLHSTHFADTAYQQLMEDSLIKAHCGWNDPVLIGKLYRTWLERNDAMATAIVAMAKGADNQPVLMIIGSGHIRHDMGVYERVEYLLPGVKQLNLAYQETRSEDEQAQNYFDSLTVAGTPFPPAHQVIWFTKRQSMEDPCERFKDQLQKRGQKKQSL